MMATIMGRLKVQQLCTKCLILSCKVFRRKKRILHHVNRKTYNNIIVIIQCVVHLYIVWIWRGSHNQGFWYFAKKKQNFAGFSGANWRKNRAISRDFRGKKSKFAEKIGRFRRRKVKIRRKIGQFRGILAERSQITKDFQRQILRKIGRFHGKFRGETSAKNNQ